MFYTVDGELDLYDLESDKAEIKDISEDDPSLTNSMVKELNQWLEVTPQPKTGSRDRNASEIDRLRALGYIP
jgi:hypothetical protein